MILDFLGLDLEMGDSVGGDFESTCHFSEHRSYSQSHANQLESTAESPSYDCFHSRGSAH